MYVFFGVFSDTMSMRKSVCVCVCVFGFPSRDLEILNDRPREI